MSKFYVTKRLRTRFSTNGFLSLSTFILVLFLLPLNIYSLDVTLDFDSWAAKIGDSKSGTVGDPTFEVKKTDDVITDDCQPADPILASKIGLVRVITNDCQPAGPMVASKMGMMNVITDDLQPAGLILASKLGML